MAGTLNRSTAQALKHGLHAHERRRILRALLEFKETPPDDATPNQVSYVGKLCSRLGDCCANPVLYADRTRSALTLGWGRCNCRICPLCRKLRSSELRDGLDKQLKQCDRLKFVTFTLKSSDDPLGDQIKHLKASFRRLRQQDEWKRKIDGGIYLVEVTFNSRTNHWHPHLHCIVQGDYYHQSSLSDAWRLASDGSFRVDIRAVHSRVMLAKYLTSYVTKGSDPTKIPARKLGEWCIAVAGARLVHTFGCLHGKSFKRDKAESGELDYIAHIAPLYSEAVKGDLRARRLWNLAMNHANKELSPRMLQWLLDLIKAWSDGYQTRGPRRKPPKKPPPSPPPSPQQWRLWHEDRQHIQAASVH